MQIPHVPGIFSYNCPKNLRKLDHGATFLYVCTFLKGVFFGVDAIMGLTSHKKS